MIPDISIVLACKGRLSFLKQTLHRNFETFQKSKLRVEFILLDYSCPQGTWEWAAKEFAGLTSMSIYRLAEEQPCWNFPLAYNTVAFLGAGNWILNLLADNIISEEFCLNLRDRIAAPCIVCHPKSSRNCQCFGTLMLPRNVFAEINGYDEQIPGYGNDDENLIYRAELYGLPRFPWDDRHITALPHPNNLRTEFLDGPQKSIDEHLRDNLRYRTADHFKANPHGRHLLMTTKVM